MKLDRDQLRAFLSRDWERITRSKDEHWRRRAQALGADAALRAADELRDHALAVCPGWPSERERVEDLQTHPRVAEALRRTARLTRDGARRRSRARRR